MTAPSYNVMARTRPRVQKGSLRRLPTVFQEVILLCDLEDLSYKEAAEALAIPIGTVMSRLHRGRAQLRSELAAADGYEPAGYTRISTTLASGKTAWVYAALG